MKSNKIALPTALIAASLLAGCGFMHNHFGRKNVEYRNSTQERPLEVPPDLDTPSTSGALIVPPAGAGTTSSSASSASMSPPASAGTSAPSTEPPSAPVAAGVQIGGDGLNVTDGVESTWTRVGLALERSGTATVLSRDPATHAYVVETNGQTTTKAGWLKRALTFGHAANKTTSKVQLTVRVSADGAASRVSVEGANDGASQDAARALLVMLRQRLS